MQKSLTSSRVMLIVLCVALWGDGTAVICRIVTRRASQ